MAHTAIGTNTETIYQKVIWKNQQRDRFEFHRVITPSEELTLGNIDTNVKLTENDSYCAYANSVSGFTTLDNKKLKEYNYKMIAENYRKERTTTLR